MVLVYLRRRSRSPKQANPSSSPTSPLSAPADDLTRRCCCRHAGIARKCYPFSGMGHLCAARPSQSPGRALPSQQVSESEAADNLRPDKQQQGTGNGGCPGCPCCDRLASLLESRAPLDKLAWGPGVIDACPKRAPLDKRTWGPRLCRGVRCLGREPPFVMAGSFSSLGYPFSRWGVPFVAGMSL